MSEITLSKGWRPIALEDCIDFVIGGDWGKAPEFEDETYKEVKCIRGAEFRRWKAEKGKTASLRKVKPNSLEKRELRKGDILLEISGGGPDQPVGRTEVVDDSVLTHDKETPKVPTNFLRLIRPTPSLCSVYLNYYLKSFYISGEVVRYQSGSNNLRNLQFKDYVKISVPIAPLNEQIRIANKLDELLAQVDTIKARVDAIPTILKRFRQSVLAAAVSGKLTEEWRGGQQLTGWKDQQLIDVVVEKPRNGNSPKGVEYETPYKNLTLSATTPGYFVEEQYKYVDIEITEDSYLWVKHGDILIQRGNTIDYVGVSAVYKGNDDRYVYPDLMMKCSANNSVLVDYLHYSLLSHKVRKYFRDNATGTAGNMPKINQKVVSSAPISLPPIEEQKQIVQRVEQLFAFADQVEQRVTDAQSRIDSLTQSILAKAFRGELVPQDPNDEPASELLARIKKEREEAAALLKETKQAAKKTAKKPAPKAKAQQAKLQRTES